MGDVAYRTLVYAHLLLFVLWLGGDVGVFVLGQHFRRRAAYTLEQRLALLKLLVAVDMGPRTAWALMVPLSLSVATAGHWVELPSWLVALAWIAGLSWLALVWDAHLHDMTPRARRDRAIEAWVKYAITAFYLWLGTSSLLTGAPIAVPWLAWKAMLFGLIFIAAILIDVAFRPVGPQLGRLIAEGSSDETEIPLRRTMDRTRIFVLIVYALLFVIAWLGVVKPA